MAGRLTTHVLDTMRGVPAAAVDVALYRVEAAARAPVGRCVTNTDGRCDAPLLAGEAFLPGSYELVFGVGAYFAAAGVVQAEPKFLDEVVIRFGLAEHRHYHVPLLISPYGYSTYRGS